MTQESLTLKQYLDETVHGSESSDMPQSLVYRGQADASWQLHSAAVRRITSTTTDIGEDGIADFEQQLIKYQNDLIANFRNRRFDTRDGTPLSDLEVLAVLQHLGAATALIDFTRSPLVALWFACEDESVDGLVYKVDAVSSRYITASSELRPTFSEALAQLIPPFHLLAWNPPAVTDAQERIVAQQSVLLLGKPRTPAGLSVPEDRVLDKVLIPRASKTQLRRELAAIGIDESALFPDIYGFAAINSAAHSLRTADVHTLLTNALRAHFERDYGNAIELYVRYLQEYPQDIVARLSLSNVYVDRGFYSHALEILNAVVETVEHVSAIDRHVYYYNRANVKAALQQHDEAIADYTRALTQRIEFDRSVRFNRGNSNCAIGSYEAALTDYENCGELASAVYNAGNAQMALGQFDQALASFSAVSSMSNAPDQCRRNHLAVQQILALLDGTEYTWRLVDTTLQISIQEAREPNGPTEFRLAGNVGNRGNAGWIATPGGQGFDGTYGIVVVVTSNGDS